MKYYILTLVSVLCIDSALFAQSPQSFKYQAVVRDAAGAVIPNQDVSFQIGIISGSVGGPVVYAETDTVTTNDFGLVILEIGNGSPVTGTFFGISWGTAPHFIKVECDPAGGTAYLSMGTTQILSVPYSLYAQSSGNTYTGGTGIDITGDTISNTLPDLTVSLAGSGATTVSGTYPGFTISSTDNNTTYFPGTGLTLSGTTFNSVWTTSGNNIYSNNPGSVGVGIITPDIWYKLHVNGQILARSGLSVAITASAGAGINQPIFRMETANTPRWEIFTYGTTDANSGKFGIRKGSGNPTLVIDSTFDVGINTTDPQTNLEVNGDVYFEGGNGDLNNDATVNAADAAIVQSYLDGNISLTHDQFGRADVSADGKVTIEDAYIIISMAVGFDRRNKIRLAGRLYGAIGDTLFGINKCLAVGDNVLTGMTPLGKLQVNQQRTGKGAYIEINNTSNSADLLYLKSNGTGRYINAFNGAYLSNGGVWTNASSRKYKTDIRPLSEKEYFQALDNLIETDVVHFRYKNCFEEKHLGIIAEDAPEEIVNETKDGLYTADFTAMLLAAIKAQQIQIECLKSDIEKLNIKLNSQQK